MLLSILASPLFQGTPHKDCVMLVNMIIFDLTTSLQSCVLLWFTIHQGNDGPSELNMIFLKRKGSKESSKLISEGDMVASDRKKPIKGVVKRDLKSSKQSHSLANCFLFQLFRAQVVLGILGWVSAEEVQIGSLEANVGFNKDVYREDQVSLKGKYLNFNCEVTHREKMLSKCCPIETLLSDIGKCLSFLWLLWFWAIYKVLC